MRRLPIVPSLVTALVAVFALACGGEAAREGGGAASADQEASARAEDPAPAEATDSAPDQPAVPALLDPNDAGRKELLTLPHFDQELVEALVSGRPYADMLAVDSLLSDRLSAEARTEVYRRLFLPLDLNAASEEEILLIPGVGDRMAHEFEEYRPYRGIEEFRREIGKYVDDQEVARLERYVRIP